MKIAIGSDHGGLALKAEVKKHLLELGHEVKDLGTDSDKSVDYPDYAGPVGRAVAGGDAQLGILVCGSGIGMEIVANKIHGVRAANCVNEYMARMSRMHNDANVLCLGERIVGGGLARGIVETFLASHFEGGRHERRVEKIGAFDKAR